MSPKIFFLARHTAILGSFAKATFVFGEIGTSINAALVALDIIGQHFHKTVLGGELDGDLEEGVHATAISLQARFEHAN